MDEKIKFLNEMAEDIEIKEIDFNKKEKELQEAALGVEKAKYDFQMEDVKLAKIYASGEVPDIEDTGSLDECKDKFFEAKKKTINLELELGVLKAELDRLKRQDRNKAYEIQIEIIMTRSVTDG
jgi:hypothetical protein